MKLTVSKSKNSASFYVQKTIRKTNGSVTTVTVEKLGNLTEVTAKAGSKDPYVWAQDYVNLLNRKQYAQNREIIVSYSPSKLLKKSEQHQPLPLVGMGLFMDYEKRFQSTPRISADRRSYLGPFAHLLYSTYGIQNS